MLEDSWEVLHHAVGKVVGIIQLHFRARAHELDGAGGLEHDGTTQTLALCFSHH